MAVSSVSPPSASPTEGDDPCEIDVSNVAIDSVTLLICLCGLAGNAAVLSLISVKNNTLFFLSLAVTDFIFLLFALPSALLFLLEDVSCSPIMPLVYLSFLFQLSMVSYYWGLFFPAVGILWVCNVIICKVCCRCDLPKRLSWILMFALFWAFFCLITVIPTVTLLCPAHEQEHCRAALTSVHALYLLLAAPMVIFCTIIIIKAKCGSQQQQPKRFDIVVVLTVLFTLLLNLWNFLQQLGYISVSSQVVFLLACINSTIKPFIYFLAGKCWSPCSVGTLRESLRRVFKEPEENTPSSNDPAMDSVI